MEKSNKSRVLLTRTVLEKYSDEEHLLSTNDIIKILRQEYGISVHRTTLAKDIKRLTDSGMDINCVHSTQNKYYVESRRFQLPELKLLVDAVASSKFITEKKSYELIKKLGRFTSVYNQERLKRNIRAESRVKPDNECSFYIVDAINTAINKNKKISFKYFDYDVKKQKILRNDGNEYIFSPYCLVWNGDYYYVVGFSDKHKDTSTFRVDRIESAPSVLNEDALPMPKDFNISDYFKTVFQMYDQRRRTVELKCTVDMMKIIIDRFGHEVKTRVLDSEHFKAVVTVALSPNFFGWLFGFGGKIKIIAPQNVKEQYIELLKAELENNTN